MQARRAAAGAPPRLGPDAVSRLAAPRRRLRVRVQAEQQQQQQQRRMVRLTVAGPPDGQPPRVIEVDDPLSAPAELISTNDSVQLQKAGITKSEAREQAAIIQAQREEITSLRAALAETQDVMFKGKSAYNNVVQTKDMQIAQLYELAASGVRERAKLRQELSDIQAEMQGTKRQLHSFMASLMALKSSMDTAGDGDVEHALELLQSSSWSQSLQAGSSAVPLSAADEDVFMQLVQMQKLSDTLVQDMRQDEELMQQGLEPRSRSSSLENSIDDALDSLDAPPPPPPKPKPKAAPARSAAPPPGAGFGGFGAKPGPAAAPAAAPPRQPPRQPPRPPSASPPPPPPPPPSGGGLWGSLLGGGGNGNGKRELAPRPCPAAPRCPPAMARLAPRALALALLVAAAAHGAAAQGAPAQSAEAPETTVTVEVLGATAAEPKVLATGADAAAVVASAAAAGSVPRSTTTCKDVCEDKCVIKVGRACQKVPTTKQVCETVKRTVLVQACTRRCATVAVEATTAVAAPAPAAAGKGPVALGLVSFAKGGKGGRRLRGAGSVAGQESRESADFLPLLALGAAALVHSHSQQQAAAAPAAAAVVPASSAAPATQQVCEDVCTNVPKQVEEQSCRQVTVDVESCVDVPQQACAKECVRRCTTVSVVEVVEVVPAGGGAVAAGAAPAAAPVLAAGSGCAVEGASPAARRGAAAAAAAGAAPAGPASDALLLEAAQPQHGARRISRLAEGQVQWQLLQQWQQRPPPAAAQLLRDLAAVHARCYHASRAAGAAQPQSQHQPQHQPQPQPQAQLLPYQQAALDAAQARLAAGQQRVLLRLPPSADVTPLIAALAGAHAPHGAVLLLVSASARVAPLAAALAALAPAAPPPRVVPGDLLRPQHGLLLVDLQQLARLPGASTQLLAHAAAARALAVYEEGFDAPPPQPEAHDAGGGGRAAPPPPEQQLPQASAFDEAARGAAQQLLRQLRFLEPNPGRPLVTVTSRGWWQPALVQPAQPAALGAQRPAQRRRRRASAAPAGDAHAAAAAEPDAGGAAADVGQPALQLGGAEAVAAGLLRRAAAVSVDTGVALPPAGAGAAALGAALGAAPRVALVAAAVRAAEGAKVVVYAGGQQHARQLAIALSLQGVGALALHDGQAPADQAAVLEAFAAPGRDQVLVSGLAGDAAATAALPRGAAAAVVMAAPARDARDYAARLAPVLLPTAPCGGGGGPPRVVVVDLVDPAAAPAPAPRAIRGDLVWTLLEGGSWAMPLRRGRGASMAGLRILWLTKSGRGWVPEIEEGLGRTSPLPGTTGRPVNLQRARTLAEAWVKAAHPNEAALRELGMDWRDRPMTDHQVLFCERHGIAYDPSWSRGTANNAIDRCVVEKMRVPATPRQAFLLRHLAPYAPSHLIAAGSSGGMTYRAAAAQLLAAILTANFLRSAAPPGGARGGGPGPGAGPGPGPVGDSVARDAVLPARAALLADLCAQYDAGLRPRHTWLGLPGGALLLDLMCGAYLWLSPLSPVAAAAAAAPGPAAAPAPRDAGRSDERGGGGSDADAGGDGGAGGEGDDELGLGLGAGGRSAACALDPAVLYVLELQLPDGTRHAVSTGPAAAALLASYAARHAPDADAGGGCQGGAGDAGGGGGGGGGAGRLAAPLPLGAAMDRAERLAGWLVTQQLAFLGREHSMRIAGMVGGWKVPTKATEQHPALPASARQLELLRAAGLPHSRRYSCLDARRELVRHAKSSGLPEPLASPSQLARIAELRLPLSPAAAGTLTGAEARALLFRVQLAEEARLADLAKARGGEQSSVRAAAAARRAAGPKRRRPRWL
ncbi:hypothetical protein HT031_006030 [Scenedesmus sp. PABB004]|nr:hypothetical protein HT031_006030 [Scenedesmus sp. PABB004]